MARQKKPVHESEKNIPSVWYDSRNCRRQGFYEMMEAEMDDHLVSLNAQIMMSLSSDCRSKSVRFDGEGSHSFENKNPILLVHCFPATDLKPLDEVYPILYIDASLL